MKRFAFLSILLSGIIFLFSFKGEKDEKYPTISIGTNIPMPEYSMKDVSGDQLSLNDVQKENGLLVLFSCNTCPFVVMWEDRYENIKNYCNRMNIGLAVVNSNEAKRDGDDSFEAMVAHAKETNYDWPYLVDEQSQLANAFGAKTTPHVFLFDGNGQLVYEGAIDDNYKDAVSVTQPYVINALTQVFSGEEVTVQTTRAVGCSIKRVAK